MAGPFVPIRFSRACRYCLNQSFLADSIGAVHPCCIFWFEREGRNLCVACRTSNTLGRRNQARMIT